MEGTFEMENKNWILLTVVALAGLLPQSNAALSGFAVLAGSGITVAGAVNTTKITGDIGTFPTLSITGIENVVFVLHGVNQAGDAVTQDAKNELDTAYSTAAGKSATTTYNPVFNLGGLTLTSGVYNDPSSFGITGTLTLDAKDDPNAFWIFQSGSTLDTASGSLVNLIGGAQACHVFWQVGSSATLGTYSDFVGTIMALTSITAKTGATVDGRLLALNGAVTLDDNKITVPTCVPEPSTWLAGLGPLVALLSTMIRRKA